MPSEFLVFDFLKDQSPPPSLSPYLSLAHMFSSPSLAHRESVLWNPYHSQNYLPLWPTKNPYYETPTMVITKTPTMVITVSLFSPGGGGGGVWLMTISDTFW